MGRIIQAITILATLIAGTAHAVDYFVNDSNNTNDVYCNDIGRVTHNGLSANTPALSLQYIIDTYDLDGGDTIFIDTGFYNLSAKPVIGPDDAGNANDWLIIQGSPEGTHLLRDTDRRSDSSLGLENTHHVEVRDIETSGASAGIYVFQSANCRITRVVGHDVNSAIQISGSNDLLIHGHVAYDCSNGGSATESSNITNQFFHYYDLGTGVSANTDVSVHLRHGLLERVGSAAASFNFADITMDHCTIHDFYAAGILQHAHKPGNVQCNNTIFAASHRFARCLQVEPDLYIGDFNSFFVEGEAMVENENATLSEWQAASLQDLNSLNVDPGFVDPDNGDFHLMSEAGHYTNDGILTNAMATSLLIDAGATTAPFANESLPNGSRANIGRYGNTAEASFSPALAPFLFADSQNTPQRLIGTQPIPLRWASGDLRPTETLRLDYRLYEGADWQPITNQIPSSVTNFSWDASNVLPSSELVWRVLLEGQEEVHDQNNIPIFFRPTDTLTFYINDANPTGDIYCTAPGHVSNSGFAPDAPLDNIANLFARYVIDPGDTVLWDTGTYTTTNSHLLVIDSGDTGSAADPLYVIGSTNVSAGGTQIMAHTPFGVGISLRNTIGVHLSNLRIKGGDFGLFLGNATLTTCENIDVEDSSDTGIFIDSSSTNSTFRHLQCLNNFQGLTCYAENTLFENSIFAFNNRYGAGLFATGCDIRHGTLVDNTRTQIEATSDLKISNSIATASLPNATVFRFSNPGINYQGDYNLFHHLPGSAFAVVATEAQSFDIWRTNTAHDTQSLFDLPLFVDAATPDFHLRSSAPSGTWVQATNDWLSFPGEISPAIDLATPSDSYANEPAWNGQRANAGAFGNTDFASRSFDGDNDTLSDAIEIHQVHTNPDRSDSDGDLYDDPSELIAGTDPNSAGSVLSVWTIVPIPGRVHMRWQTVPGRIYSVQKTTDITSNVWETDSFRSNLVGNGSILDFVSSVQSEEFPGLLFRVIVHE